MTAASAKRSEKVAKAGRTKHVVKNPPGALNAWNGLVTSITNDVKLFSPLPQLSHAAACGYYDRAVPPCDRTNARMS